MAFIMEIAPPVIRYSEKLICVATLEIELDQISGEPRPGCARQIHRAGRTAGLPIMSRRCRALQLAAPAADGARAMPDVALPRRSHIFG